MIKNSSTILVFLCLTGHFFLTSCSRPSDKSDETGRMVELKPIAKPIYITSPTEDTTAVVPPQVSLYDFKKDKRKVRYGDTFNGILKSIGIAKPLVNEITSKIPTYVASKDFKVGNAYEVIYPAGSKNPSLINYDLSETSAMQIDLKTGEVSRLEKEVDIEIKKISSLINSSLAGSLLEIGAPEDLADKILSTFAWKIDFKNLKKGDSYELIYEDQSVGGEPISSGFIHSITFNHDQKIYTAYGFDNGNGIEYFDGQGLNMSHAPLQFDIITSLYAQRRFHPTQRRTKPHYGMDFEAPEGTPIESIKDGVITRVRYDGANGNNVKIQHSKDLTTQYLHMSAIDPLMVVGASVKQGQVIGLVGSTGYSSGPHLCLRVWYKGKQRDPLNFDFPRREDIKDSLMADFKAYVAEQSLALSEY